MNEFTLFSIEVVFSLIISGLVIFTLSQALYTLILELCGTEARAKFWISYLNVMLVITPLLAVFIFGTSSMLVQASFGFFRNALTCILSGIFVSLSAIGFQIMQSIPNKSQQNNDPWRESPNG